MMNKSEIERILPHRHPMLLIEQVGINEDGSAFGTYTVRGDEFFLQGHFPGDPVVPGVILCEMMAQTCAVLLAENSSGKTPYFTSLDKVRFRNVVKPGDTIEFVCKIKKQRTPFYFAEGKGRVNEKLSVEGEFSFALIGGE